MGGVLAQVNGGTGAVSYLLTDGHGSTRQVIGSAGAVNAFIAYDAFGNPLTPTTGTSYLYTGQRFDAAAGMYDLRARFYQPQIGRFSTSDNITITPGDLGNANLYLYVDDNAPNMFDLSGHDENAISQLSTVGIAAGLATLIAAGAAQSITKAIRLRDILSVGDEIGDLLTSGERYLTQAGILMAANTAVVAQAIARAKARAGAAVANLPSPPAIFPIIKSMGPAVFALDVTALALNPSWSLLNYNGPRSPLTFTNRLAVARPCLKTVCRA